MPTHHCIPCATTTVRCCICAGHQHGLYGVPGESALAGDPGWAAALGAQGQRRGREAAQRLLRNLGGAVDTFAVAFNGLVQPLATVVQNRDVYVRTDSTGVQKLFVRVDDVEVELIAVPAIPAKPPTPEPKLTLWDHLLKDD